MEENKEEFTSESTATKKEIAKDAQGLFEKIKSFLYELLDFRHDTDQEATIEAIKQDVTFKGATTWILICSIFVASIGLNANSTAVVIGAMLISPLMGPILGVGMSIAINDIDTMRKSLINLATMIVLSLLTAYLFFKFFPLGDRETSELLGRTSPDIRDVLIAFFGGLALIIARTKKGTIASVIFGVAIATALMPPLCTAGYGLANGNPSYFLGAMNLFTINTIFIALATFIVLKVLRFPMLRYANSKSRKRTAQIASLVAIVVMIYPTITFLRVLEESRIQSQVSSFIKNEVKEIPNFQLIDDSFDKDKKEIKLNFFNEVTEGERNLLKNQLNKDIYNKIKDFDIKIKGSDTKSYDLITTAYKEKREELEESKNVIAGLQNQIKELQTTITSLNQRIEQQAQQQNASSVAFSSIARDAKIRYNDIVEIGYAKELVSKDFIKVDTLNFVEIRWNKSLPDSTLIKKETELQAWLQTQMKLDTVFMKRK